MPAGHRQMKGNERPLLPRLRRDRYARLGLTYDPDSGLCADADDFETSEPTCPEGYRWDVTSRACVLVG